MTPTKLLLIGWAGLMLWGIHPALVASLPVRMTHTLAPSCHWKAKPWAERVGAYDNPRPTREGLAAAWRCVHARGLKAPGPIPDLKEVRTKWPSRAELTAWDSRQDIPANAYNLLSLSARVGTHPVEPSAGH